VSCSSSTSSDACQKNRYGDTVVPAIAVRAIMVAASKWNCGRKVRAATVDHGTRTTTRTRTYATSERANQRSTLE